MTARRILIVGGLASAALATGSVALISWQTRVRSVVAEHAKAPPAPPIAAAVPTALPPSAPSSAAAVPPSIGEAAPLREAPPLATPPPPPPGPGPNPLNPMQRAPVRNLAGWRPSRARYMLTSAIAQQRPKLAACFVRETAANGASPRPASRRALPGDTGLGVLTLQLEPVQDGMRIVDAPMERRGSATAEEIACAQAALRGATIRVPGTRPGPAIAMPYPLD